MCRCHETQKNNIFAFALLLSLHIQFLWKKCLMNFVYDLNYHMVRAWVQFLQPVTVWRLFIPFFFSFFLFPSISVLFFFCFFFSILLFNFISSRQYIKKGTRRHLVGAFIAFYFVSLRLLFNSPVFFLFSFFGFHF